MPEKYAYRLINPYIEGKFDNIVQSRSMRGAGIKLYNNLSQYFTNHVDDFYLTIQNLQSKEMGHFRVNEERNNDKVDFKLIQLEGGFSPELEQELIDHVTKLEQTGGRKHKHRDSSDSSSSSSSDNYFSYFPINRFVYYMLPYYTLNVSGLSPLDASRLWMPMFSWPINPSMEIRLDLYR